MMAEKKAQIEMMVEWRESLIKSEELLVDSCVKRIDELLVSSYLNDQGVAKVRSAVMRHGYASVMDQINAAYQRCSKI